MPCWTASSKLVSETALISVTVATLISSVESPLFSDARSLLLLTFFAYHLKGEAKHIGGRPLNTHRKRPIAPPRSARPAGEGMPLQRTLDHLCTRPQRGVAS